MRSIFALSFLMVLATGTAFAQDLESDKGKLSYSVGWDLGADIKRRGEEFDVEAVIAAIRDSVAGVDPKVDVNEMRQLLTALQEKVRREEMEAFQQMAQENQAKSEAFLEENKAKTGIAVLPSGLQYRVIEEGDGARPALDSTIRMHFRASRMDGIEVASSFTRGVPQEFPVSQVPIEGWKEVLPLMKVGSTWQIFVPPELAYGPQGNMPAIGPNEVVMFDLKLVEIMPN